LSTQNTNVSDFPNLKMSVLGSGGGRARSPHSQNYIHRLSVTDAKKRDRPPYDLHELQ
jgi:hypothetical protein